MRFEGVMPAAMTPFTSENEVDVEALRANVEWMRDAGCTGFVACGTMGEGGSLSHGRAARSWSRPSWAPSGRAGDRGRVRGHPGRGAPLRRRRRGGAGAGADAAAAVGLPRPTSASSSRYYRALAEATALPIMAYNNPAASGGTDMAPETIGRLAREVDAVVAIKECSGDARRHRRAARARRRARGAGRWRRLGARGLLRRRHGLGRRRGRGRAARVRRAVRGLPRGRARARPRDLPAPAAARAPRHDAQARPVLQGRDRRGGPLRRADAGRRACRWTTPSGRRSTPPCAPCARRNRHEGGARPARGRLPHRGDADARGHRRGRCHPGRDDARAQAALRARAGRPAPAAHARAARAQRDVGRDPAAADCTPTPTGAWCSSRSRAACRCAATGRSAWPPCSSRPAWSR